MKKLALALSGMLACGAVGVAVADQYEDAIKYRQSAFTLVKGNLGPMGAMVKGETPFDSAAFQRHAENLAALSMMTGDGFIEGSDLGDTKARPAVWEKRAAFDEKMEEFRKASADLAAAAKSGNLDTVKRPFAVAAKTCKSCHDDFKSK